MILIPWIWKLEYHSTSIIVITPASWLSSRKNLILCLHSANVLSSSFLNVKIDEFIDDRNVGMLNIFQGISQGISQDLTSMVRMSWRALKGLLSWKWVWGQLSRKVGNESDGDLKFGGNGIDCLQTELSWTEWWRYRYLRFLRFYQHQNAAVQIESWYRPYNMYT